MSFALTSKDVIHSFWVPQLGGKRDAVTNHTNHIWYTPESEAVWNGFCAEYCGTSHANMRFRAFAVAPEAFERWVAHQKTGPAFTAPAATPAATQTTPAAPAASPAPAPDSAMPPAQLVTGTVPLDQLPGYAVPTTPIPAGLEVTGVTGDPARGAQLYRTGACIACHIVQGVSPGIVGPNLTHVGSRTTIAAGLFPNDERHLRAWIKNAPRMKPGSLMPALGKSDAVPGGYTDQQIADIAAYLLSLK